MLVIRLCRVGRHNHAQYRIVVQEKSKAPTGKHIAIVGSWDPHLKNVVLKKEQITEFLKNGAQPSDTVYNLLVENGVITGDKRVVKIPAKKQEEQKAEENVENADAAKEEKADTAEEAPEKEEKDAEEK